MKKIICVLLFLMTTLTLVGCCGTDVGIQMNSDGSGKMYVCFMIDSGIYKNGMKIKELKDEVDALKDYTVTKKMYDDVYYVCYTKEVSFANSKELEKITTDANTYGKLFFDNTDDKDSERSDIVEPLFSSCTASNEFVRAAVTTESMGFEEDGIYNMENIDSTMPSSFFMLVNMTFDKEITYTNGTLSEDKKTASWKIDYTETQDVLLEASTAGKDAITKDTKAPKIYPVKNGVYYRGDVNVIVSDNVAVKKVTCNKKEIPADFTIYDTGKYVYTAEDFSGNKSKTTFYLDNVDPMIKGVKNGVVYRSNRKISFSDNYKIASATLNGKKVKSGVTIKRNGRYNVTVRDKAGNRTSVSFRINKRN